MILSLEERKRFKEGKVFSHPTPKFENFKLYKKDNFIVSIYLTGGRHYGNFPRKKSIEHLRVWSESLLKNNLTGIMFHNCFTLEEISTFQNLPVKFIEVSMPKRYASGMFRFELYNKFLEQFADCIDNIFFTDSTDLDVLKNPFIQPNYSRDKIYIGYEPVIKDNKWMKGATNGFKQYDELCKKDKLFANSPLLNAGLVGGSLESVKYFIKRVYQECSRLYPINYCQDMPIINYLAYTEWKNSVEFGSHVNTVFTGYEKDNTKAWFRHK